MFSTRHSLAILFSLLASIAGWTIPLEDIGTEPSDQIEYHRQLGTSCDKSCDSSCDFASWSCDSGCDSSCDQSDSPPPPSPSPPPPRPSPPPPSPSPPQPSPPPPLTPPFPYKIVWVDDSMPQSKVNGGTVSSPTYNAEFTGMKLQLTHNGEPVAGHTISFSTSKPNAMVCSFGAMSDSYYQATTNSNGYVTLGDWSSKVRMYYKSGVCTISANANIDGLDVLTGTLTSTTPVTPEDVEGATLSDASGGGGAVTLQLDGGDRVSGTIPAHSVMVRGADGAPLPNAYVVWSVQSSGGLSSQFTPAGAMDTRTTVSGANGVAVLDDMRGDAALVYSSNMNGFTTAFTVRAKYGEQTIDVTTTVTGPAF